MKWRRKCSWKWQQINHEMAQKSERKLKENVNYLYNFFFSISRPTLITIYIDLRLA